MNRFCVNFFIITVVCLTLNAQSDRGTIKGLVVDAQGLAAPNAKLTLLNSATGVRWEAASDTTGGFLFSALPVGRYEVTCKLAGFKTFTETGVAVEVGSTTSLTATLEPGEIVETITVEARGSTLDRETSDIGTAVSRTQIMDLPVPLTGSMRNPLNFVILTPGVSGSIPRDVPDLRLNVSGTPSASTDVFIDGVPIADTNATGATGSNHPSLEAIGEFKISNNSFAAQHGLASSIVSFTIRSGTNQLHASAFEFLQNDKLNALDFPTKTRGGVKAPLKQNEYGFTAGGPVLIPKLYNGRDHTFFFVSYTWFRYRPSSNNLNLTTFPNRFRQGDFSQLLSNQLSAPDPTNPSQRLPVFDAAGRPVVTGAIYDPTTSHSVTGPDGRSYPVRDPFAGNIIPASYPGLSAVAKKVLASFPQASSDALFNNFSRQTSSTVDEERFVAKIDHALSQRQNLSGSVSLGGSLTRNIGTLNLLDATKSDSPSIQARLAHNFTISPHMVNSLTFGFLRDTFNNVPVQPGPSFESLGISGISLPPGSPYPSIQIRNLNAIGTETYSIVAQNRFIVNDSVTWNRGGHNIKIGGEVRRLQRNEIANNAGRFVFEPTQTALNGTGFVNTSQGPRTVSIPAGTGSAAASFLFGAMDFSRVVLGYTTAGYRWLTTSGYIQDDWKVTRSLTLNLGLRYDFSIPRTEVLGRVSTLDISMPNPSAGNVAGAYSFYGSGPGRNGKARIGDIDWKTFQPRIGLAWSPLQRTVIRSSFAVARPLGNDNLTNGIGSGLYSNGFNGLATVNRPGDVLGSPAYFWDRPFPGFTPPPTIDPGLLVGNVNPALIYSEAGKMPTQINWAFEIQHEIKGGFQATAAYVGTHIYHLGLWRKPNQVSVAASEQFRSAAQAAGMPLNEYLNLRIDDPRVVASGARPPFPTFVQLFGAGATLAQAIRPFPQYGNIDNLQVPMGSTSYNGLQTKLQKRFSAGLTLLASYTYSKTIGDVDSFIGVDAGAQNARFGRSFQQDYYNNAGERSVTSSDIPHVLTLSYAYELPFGPGKHFLPQRGVVGKIVGGWQVSAIHLYQSGRPLFMEYDTAGSSNPYRANDGFSFRANVVPGVPVMNPNWDRRCSGPLPATAGRSSCQFYINPEAFVAPPTGEFGNSAKFLANLRGQPYFNEDLSVSKRTRITEKVTLQFRANAFNVFNRVVLGTGGASMTIFNNAPRDLSAASLATSNTPFGILTAQQNGPRRMQFGLKLEF